MIYLKSYKIFESRDNQFFKTKEETKDWLDEVSIGKYTINDDLTVDVDGDVDLNNKKLEKIPVKFKSIGGYFNCGSNQLTSLEGCPKSVGGHFYCNNNKLTSLDGSPESVGGHFYCNNNKLTNLEGSPEGVVGYFNCRDNQLTSLDGSPESVGGSFNCGYNQLTSLKGSPDSVGGHFYCRYNQLTNLDGSPESVGGSFYCDHNPIEEVYNLFNNKECVKWLNEYGVIRGDKIILNNFKEVVYMMDMEHTFDYKKLYKLKNYKAI